MKSAGLKKINLKLLIEKIEGKKEKDVYYQHFFKKRFVLHWGGLGDPFCNFEKSNATGYDLINELGKMNYPCLFSLKGGAILNKDYIKLFEKYAHQKNFAFQFSIINADPTTAKKIEIGVPSPIKRIEAMKIYSQMGYWTILRLRPFVIGISDLSLKKLLEESKKAGMNAISTEFLALDVRANVGMKDRYSWLAKAMGIRGGVSGLHKYFLTLSPSSRGGYMRLNRLVKEQYVKEMYTFCLENKIHFACSDPDYKELNMSGSCCGMPDNYSGNQGLNNWTRAQLTEHLRLARKEYHTSGKIKELYFNTVYSEKARYLDDVILARDHPCGVEMSQGERNAMTHRKKLNETWNNLKSSANPYNYFHGKMYPARIDENGDIVFRYEPSEYETRWKEDGIRLDQ